MGVDGAEAVDLLVMPKDAGDQWLSSTSISPKRPHPVRAAHGRRCRRGTPLSKSAPIAKGRYYLVVDNTATAGRVSPPPNLFDDRAALVNYAVQLGDAP